MREASKRADYLKDFYNYGISKVTITLICYIATGAMVFSSPTAFGVAFVAASPAQYLLPASIGAVLGYIVPLSGGMDLTYLVAVFVAGSLSFVLQSDKMTKKLLEFKILIAFSSVFISGVIITAVTSLTLQGIMLVLLQSIIAGGITFFASDCYDLIGKNNYGLFEVKKYSLGIIYTLVLIALVPVTVFDFSVGHILAFIIILSAGKLSGMGSSAVCGGITALTVLLVNPELTTLAVGICITAMVSGLFIKLSVFAQGLIFITSFACFGLLMGEGSFAIYTLESAFSAAVFFAISPSAGRLAKRIKPTAQDNFKQIAVGKIDAIKSAVDYIATTTERIATIAEKNQRLDIPTVIDMAQEKICSRCSSHATCFGSGYSDISDAFSKMGTGLRVDGAVKMEVIPDYFKNLCVNYKLIAREMTNQGENINSVTDMSKVEVSKLLSGQLNVFSDFMDILKIEINEITSFDEEGAILLKKALRDLGFPVFSVKMIKDKFGRYKIIINTKDTGQIDTEIIHQIIERSTARLFTKPTTTEVQGTLRVTAEERADLAVEIGSYQITHKGNKHSGDSVDYFAGDDGKYNIILTDGMGSGERAAVDGGISCNMLSKLVDAGINIKTAINMIEGIMLSKPWEESAVALDCFELDLFTGNGVFYKSGASSSLVVRGGRSKFIAMESLPVGIVSGAEPAQKNVRLQAGDIVVIASDGGLIEQGRGMETLVMNSGGLDIKDLAVKIANKAAAIHKVDDTDDDITVCVIRIIKA